MRKRSGHRQSLTRLQIMAYGAPGVPLAAATLPIFILVPTLYSQTFGLSLFAIGNILIIVRLIDAISDPIVGMLSDRIGSKFGPRKPWIALSTPFLMLSIFKVLVPPPSPTITYLLVWSVALTVTWTCFVLPYTAWGAEMSEDRNMRTQITASREGLTLLGTLLIATFPAIFTMAGYPLLEDHTLGIAVFVLILLPITTLIALAFTSQAPHKAPRPIPFRESMTLVAENRPFRILLGSYFLNSFANGLPATLFVFYVGYVLELPESYGLLLLAYFVSALIGIPFWYYLSIKIGKREAWSIAMIVAMLFFVWTPFLIGSSYISLFTVIVIATGLTLGADLILPPSMQADVIDLDRKRSQMERAGLFFALWGVSTKMALGLSSGIAFLLLGFVGFDPQSSGQATEQPSFELQTLAIIYGLIPVLFKLLSILLMRRIAEFK